MVSKIIVLIRLSLKKFQKCLEISSREGFSLAGFFGPSSAVQVNSHPLPEVLVASSSALVVKEDEVEGVFPFSLGGCSSVAPAADKGEDFRLTGLIQSQKWLVGFGPSSVIVVWDLGDNFWDGEDGDFPYPLGAFPPPCPWIGIWIVIRLFVTPRFHIGKMRRSPHRVGGL
jgi:hypothetical protein